MALTFALPPGAAEPRETEHWTYDRATGQVTNAEGRIVLYVSASRMDSLDVTGGRGRATRTGHLAAAAPDMLAVLKAILADDHPDTRLRPDQIAGARAAVAKATGGVK